jgi:hypothetical protein
MFAVHSLMAFAIVSLGSVCAEPDQDLSHYEISVEQEFVPYSTIWSPQDTMHREYLRYGVSMAHPAPARIRARQNGQTTVEAQPVSLDKNYVSTVRVGKQVFKVSLDTGSADL